MARDYSRLPQVLGINRRNLELIYPHNPRSGFPVVDDKIRTKEALTAAGVPVPETLRVVDNFLAVGQAIEALRAQPTFVVKPARGRAGGGVLLIERSAEGLWRTPSGHALGEEQLAKHFGDILFGVYSFGRMDDRVLVERRLEQHSFFADIFAGGVADVRVILLKEQPLMAMLRLPTRASDGKANLHQGGMGVPVGMDSGRTGTAIWRGRDAERHPDTGVVVSGLEVPFWGQMLDFSVRAARAMPLKYIGVDLVLDRRLGPLMLEVNARPGLQVQVVNGRGLGDLTGALGGRRA